MTLLVEKIKAVFEEWRLAGALFLETLKPSAPCG
jgi:hypothetical protein